MMMSQKKIFLIITTFSWRIFFIICSSKVVVTVVNADNIFDWIPSISLTANYGVTEGLCLDIAGFGNNLHCDGIIQLHTCKAQGSDTQFVYDGIQNQIRSVNYNENCQSTGGNHYDGACVTIINNNNGDDDETNEIDVGDTMTLSSCQDDNNMNQFFHYTNNGTIRTTSNTTTTGNSLCLAKTSNVGPAGNNERTDLALVDCENNSNNPMIDIIWTVISDVTSSPTSPPTSSTTIPANGTQTPSPSSTTPPSKTPYPTTSITPTNTVSSDSDPTP